MKDTSPAGRKRRRAMRLADRLRQEGRQMDADIVASLVRSSVTQTSNNSALWEDNRRLRERIAQAEREASR